ncbi:30S ribosomal protein S16, partial [Escherichia coli]
MAVKIKLQRMGKIRNAEYRVIIADARTRRSGKAIENIGIYQPKQEPSLIQIDSERAQYWLGVGAQPTEPVLALLKVTGDWQKFKGLP